MALVEFKSAEEALNRLQLMQETIQRYPEKEANLSEFLKTVRWLEETGGPLEAVYKVTDDSSKQFVLMPVAVRNAYAEIEAINAFFDAELTKPTPGEDEAPVTWMLTDSEFDFLVDLLESVSRQGEWPSSGEDLDHENKAHLYSILSKLHATYQHDAQEAQDAS